MIFSLTGAVIVFYDELNEILYSDLLKVELHEGERAGFQEVYNLVSQRYTEYIPYRINQGINHEDETIEVGLQKDNFKERFSVYVDPYQRRILGKLENPLTLIIVKIHYTFYLGRAGELMAAVFAISFIAYCLQKIFLESLIIQGSFKVEELENSIF